MLLRSRVHFRHSSALLGALAGGGVLSPELLAGLVAGGANAAITASAALQRLRDTRAI